MAAPEARIPEEVRKRLSDAALDLMDLLEAPLVVADNSIDLALEGFDTVTECISLISDTKTEITSSVSDDVESTARDIRDLIGDLGSDFHETVGWISDTVKGHSRGFDERVVNKIIRDIEEFNRANRELIEV